MRIPDFEIRSQRSIELARCEQVPPLMIIAGPNGAGKSTLLNALRSARGTEHVLYVGPHRATRRQTVQQRHLITTKISLEELFSRMDVPGFEGIQTAGGIRDAWSSDDSANYLKHALCQIEVERQRAVTARFDRVGEIPRDTVVDPWLPLRELTHSLLPHLAFMRIDTSDRNAVRCLWQVHSRNIVIDYDDLSSGEKSIVQMFYPLVEHGIRTLIAEIEFGAQIQERPDICVLLDEPELHLHPNLQLKVLDYLRTLTNDSNLQVILATHSPSIVEYASFDELYLLRPVELLDTDRNQLIQVASDEERLRFLRQTFGGTSNLTTMQPIVIIEGISEANATKVVPDRKLYRALHPAFGQITLIAGGGKSECRSLLQSLNGALRAFAPQLQAIALLDRDTEVTTTDENIFLLPVAMIENLLLDPKVIWEAIQSVIDKTQFATVADIEEALDSVLDLLETEEIEHRIIVDLGMMRFRPKAPVAQISEQAHTFLSEMQQQYSVERVLQVSNHAQEKVQELRQLHRRREEFHGKTVLSHFYKQYLHSTGLPRTIFTFEAARYAQQRKSVARYFDGLFASLASEIAG